MEEFVPKNIRNFLINSLEKIAFLSEDPNVYRTMKTCSFCIEQTGVYLRGVFERKDKTTDQHLGFESYGYPIEQALDLPLYTPQKTASQSQPKYTESEDDVCFGPERSKIIVNQLK
jgi:hypothetical protein